MSGGSSSPPVSGDALCPDCGAACTIGEGARCAACGADARLDRRYLLRRVLGANVGTTYLADELATGRRVVVKELHFARLDAWKTEELFAREAQVLRQLDHPRIPRYLDSFSLGQGKQLRSYLVQQHLEGRDLRAELADRRYSENDVFDLLDDVLEILEYLQRMKPPIIHRDLKPSNLMRLPDGHVALIDFGSVRDLVAPSGSNATVAGTFGFMAPEQFQGDAFLSTDLYGLGAVAVQLLGRVSPDKMLASGTTLEWRPHVRASAPVLALLGQLLAPDPGDRPADARAARALVRETRAAFLRPAVAAPSREAPSLRTHERDEARVPVAAKGRRSAAMVAMGALLLAAGAGVAMYTVRRPPADRAASTSPQPPRPLASTAPESPSAPRPPSRPAAEPIPSLARDLPKDEMIALLVAQSWEGTLAGRLVFSRTAGGVAAKLHTPGGQALAFRSVELGPLATLTLTLEQQVGGVTTTDTFHGALSADRKTLFGGHEKRYREGVHDQREDGTFRVSAVAAP